MGNDIILAGCLGFGCVGLVLSLIIVIAAEASRRLAVTLRVPTGQCNFPVYIPQPANYTALHPIADGKCRCSCSDPYTQTSATEGMPFSEHLESRASRSRQ